MSVYCKGRARRCVVTYRAPMFGGLMVMQRESVSATSECAARLRIKLASPGACDIHVQCLSWWDDPFDDLAERQMEGVRNPPRDFSDLAEKCKRLRVIRKVCGPSAMEAVLGLPQDQAEALGVGI